MRKNAKQKEKWEGKWGVGRKKAAARVGLAGLLICTAIGAYGIWKAPESDQGELERELAHNAWLLERAGQQAPTAAAISASPISASRAKRRNEGLVSVIGDSVFLGAAPAFQKLQGNAVVDARISRQVRDAIDVAKKLDGRDKLGDTVIISLGTNGKFNPATGRELLDYLGARRTVYWINAYGRHLEFQEEVNEAIQNLADKYDNVRVIPWDGEGKKHPDWFYQDGIHLNARGQKGFALFVKKHIVKSEELRYNFR